VETVEPFFYHVPLFGVLIVACYTDLSVKKVYNWTTLPGMLLGLTLHAGLQGMQGFMDSLLGCGLGLVVFGTAYLMGGMGGGDVKLAGAIGALGGVSLSFWSIVYSGFIGGIMALVLLVWQGKLRRGTSAAVQGLLRLKSPDPEHVRLKGEVPYGVAMVVGTFLAIGRTYVAEDMARWFLERGVA